MLSTPDDRWKAAVSVASGSLNYERGAGDLLPDGDVDFRFWVASLQYESETITLTTEYMREPISWDGFAGTIFSGFRTEVEGYYVQAAWRLSESLEATIRYENGVFDREDRSGVRFSERTAGLIPAFAGYSEIWSAGLKYSFSEQWLLSSEYQRHRGTLVLSGKENNVKDLRPEWDLFALTLSYRF